MSSKTSRTALSNAYANLVDALMIATDSRSGQRWLITAAGLGDGTTTTAIGIARALAARKSKCLLIDANLRDRCISRRLDNPSAPGLIQAIAEGQPAAEVCQAGRTLGDFSVVGVGGEEVAPLELFAKPRAAELLDELSGQFEFVVIDTPALEEGLEALWLAPHVDGCVLVVRAAKTGKRALKRARQQIEQAGGKILGTALNRSIRSN